MPRPGCPLTPDQVRILACCNGGSRARDIATKSGLKIEGIYPRLARLVGRRLLARSRRRPPTYKLTVEGESQLEASRAYFERMNR